MKRYVVLFLILTTLVFAQKNVNKGNSDQVKKYSKEYFVELENQRNLSLLLASENFNMMYFIKIAYANFGKNKQGKDIDVNTYRSTMDKFLKNYIKAMNFHYRNYYEKSIFMFRQGREEMNTLLMSLVDVYRKRTDKLLDEVLESIIKNKNKYSVGTAEYMITQAGLYMKRAEEWVNRYKEMKANKEDVYNKYTVADSAMKKNFPTYTKMKLYKKINYIKYPNNPEWGLVYAIENFRKAKHYIFLAYRMANLPIKAEYDLDRIDNKNQVYEKKRFLLY